MNIISAINFNDNYYKFILLFIEALNILSVSDWFKYPD